MGELRVRGC